MVKRRYTQYAEKRGLIKETEVASEEWTLYFAAEKAKHCFILYSHFGEFGLNALSLLLDVAIDNEYHVYWEEDLKEILEKEEYAFRNYYFTLPTKDECDNYDTQISECKKYVDYYVQNNILRRYAYIEGEAYKEKATIKYQFNYDKLKEIKYTELGAENIGDLGGYVYILHTKHGYKVGKTKNDIERIRTINTMMPVDVFRVDVFHTRNRHIAEKFIHSLFAEKRMKGEWFEVNIVDVQEIGYILREMSNAWYSTEKTMDMIDTYWKYYNIYSNFEPQPIDTRNLLWYSDKKEK